MNLLLGTKADSLGNGSAAAFAMPVNKGSANLIVSSIISYSQIN